MKTILLVLLAIIILSLAYKYYPETTQNVLQKTGDVTVNLTTKAYEKGTNYLDEYIDNATNVSDS